MKSFVFFIISVLFCITQSYARELTIPIMKKPHIDGIISEGDWTSAVAASDFIQLEPYKGEPATEKTEVFAGYDNKHLFIAFKCFYTNTLSAGSPMRDQLLNQINKSTSISTDDGVILILDTFNDKRSAYVFHINIKNTQSDVRVESNGSNTDSEWDTEWKSAVSIDEKFYTIEISLPFKSIKYTSLKTWGINFGRMISDNQEIVWWSGILDDNFRISQNGTLQFQKTLHQKKPVVLIPYTNVYQASNETWKTEIGLDAEIPLPLNMTANATINPDFASVEGDEEVINLDPWEVSRAEKRSFFRDINALFQVRYKPFYSRRIGDIQHGEKFTGKIKGTQIAGIYARTNVIEADSAKRIKYQPEADFLVLRLQQDILKASTIGFTVTQKKQHNFSTKRLFNLDTKMRLPYHIYATGQILYAQPAHKGVKKLDHAGGFIRVASETNTYHIHGRLTMFGKHLKENMDATGYLQYDDVIEYDSAVRYKYFPKTYSAIKMIYYNSNYRWDWSLDRILQRYEIRQEASVYLKNKINVGLNAHYEYRDAIWRKTGQTFSHKDRVEFELGYNTLEYNQVLVNYGVGQDFDGPLNWYGGWAQFDVTKKIGFSYEFENRMYNKKKADPIATDVNLHIIGADVRFSPDLFIRLFSQYRSDSNRIYFYGRLGWRFRAPNSAVYLTYSYDDDDNRIEPYRIVFAKFSYDFNLSIY